jgi:hypothetical protein
MEFSRYCCPKVVFDSRGVPRFEPIVGQFLRLKCPRLFRIDVEIPDIALSILSAILKISRFESNLGALGAVANGVILLSAFPTKHQRYKQLRTIAGHKLLRVKR